MQLIKYLFDNFKAPPLPPEDLEPPLSNRGEDSKVNEGDNPEAGITKSNSQMQLMQSGQGSHEVQGVNSNTGLQSASNMSSPRSMMAIGRGRGTMIHGGGNFGHMQNAGPPGSMHMPGQHPYAGMTGVHSGKPMGNMPNVGGNMPVGAMQGMGRGGNLMAQRGKFGKKGKTRNIPTQGGPVGKGKGIPGVPGGNTQSGMISSQGGKPSMGMFSQGGNSIPPNVSGSGSMSGNMIGPGQQWGSNNMMGGMQNSSSGNSQFGSSNPGTTANSSGYGSSGVGGQPSQPPPHYNAAVAQQQMIQNASGGNSSHMTQATRFPNINAAGSHSTGAPIGPGHSGKQALQNMLRARGPQFMNTAGNAQSGNTPGNQAQFVSPRQNFQGAQSQASNSNIQGTTGGASNRFGNIGGASGNVGATSGINSRMQNQFSNQNLAMGQSSSSQFSSGSYGSSPQVSSASSSGSMSGMNSYMMRGSQPGSYSTNNQVMMNRQNVMGGNMPGGPGQGGNFMPRMGQNNYMQSPNVNMGNVMQGGSYRNMGSGMQPQANSGNINQSNMDRMRMQNPHLLAQLQRSPANAPPNSQNQQHGNPFQQNRF